MKFADIVPIDQLQSLCESFTAFTGAVMAVLDLDGNILVATGWQDICTKFHRTNAETAVRCRESDTALAGQLSSGVRYNVYKCKNGLVDVAVPIIVGGEHVANFFTGQFFFEEPDADYFLKQADRFGFDKDGYLQALGKAPVFTEDKVRMMMEFFTRLAGLIGDMGLAQASKDRAVIDLSESQRLLQTIIDTVPMRVFWKDANLRYLGCNPAFAADAGKGHPDEVIGQSDYQMAWVEQADIYRADDQSVIDSAASKLSYDEPITIADGSTAWIRTSKVPLRNKDNEIIGILGTYDDITERRNAENKIIELAYYDPLTGLPNRRLLKDRLNQAMISSARNEREGALLFIDLDNFKTINDTQGHDNGDRLLQEVAARFGAGIRGADTVARIGGDEFVVVLTDLSEDAEEAASQAKLVGEKIVAIIGEPYRINGLEFRCTPSIGISMFGTPCRSTDELMREADIAMYQAKSSGRNTLRFFDPILQTVIKEKAALETDLREGLSHLQFALHYQPQVGEDGRLTGAEALLRWHHPQRGMVSPSDFITLAEETGLILPLGQWVLETACSQLARWATRPALASLSIAVNVSARQFRQPDFVESVITTINKTGARPQRLKLELTESILIDNVQDVITKMDLLKAEGVNFSLDDFGTGYSSLSYLQRLPLSQLKIDQSFVKDALNSKNDATIVKTIVAFAQSFGLDVIAEGVETSGQREFLAHVGCLAYQGYLFGRPLPTEEFERLANQPRPAG